jgi:hypothetical protein
MISISLIRSVLCRSIQVISMAAILLVPAVPAGAASKPPALTSPWEGVWDSDGYWTRDFAVPGVDGAVTVTEAVGADLYVGGSFTQADGVETPTLVRFDGHAWHAFTAMYSGQPPTAMLADGSGVLVAGQFYDVPFRERHVVIRWGRDGTTTKIGGTSMQGHVVRLFRWNGAVVAAGYLRFDEEPSAVHLLARLGRDGWEPLGPRGDFEGAFQVQDAVVFQGRIVVGGRFGAFGQDSRGLLSLQPGGNAFDTLLTGPPVQALSVEKLEVHNGRLVAAGYFSFESEPMVRVGHNLVEWDGNAWSPLDDGFYGSITALRSTGAGLLIGGRMFPKSPPPGANVLAAVARLGASGFEPIPGLDGTGVLTLTDWAGHVVAGGRRIPDNGVAGPFLSLAVHERDSWRSVGAGSGRAAGLDSFYGMPGYASTQVFLEADGKWFAGGQFDVAWSSDRWLRVGPVAQWSGSGWIPLGSNELRGTASTLAWYRDHLYAAGRFDLQTENGYVSTQLIRLDGGVWRVVEGAPQGDLTSLAVMNDHLIVGGYLFDTAMQLNGVVVYDGSAWSTIATLTGSPNPGRVHALLVHAGALYAAGYFDNIAGISADGVARWDGQAWHPLGDGFRGRARALAVHDGRIAVGGECETQPCTNVQLWDGAEWTHLPDAPFGILAMASRAGILFVGGQFGGRDRYYDNDGRMRAWDGRAWHALGSGFHTELDFPQSYPVQVNALGVRGDILWVGGSFTRAGGQTAMNVATWTGLTRRGRAQRSLRDEVLVTPNPSRPGATIALEIDGGAAEVGIYDLAGRRLQTVTAASDGERASATWDGRGADGKSVPAGIYFARATREGRVIATRRLIRLP